MLRTKDGVSVQSRGEKRIADWLARRNIAYLYDERIEVAGDFALRPDFIFQNLIFILNIGG